MAQSPATQCDGVDDSFGPYAGSACRGGFDFTLLFEESVLTLLPLGLLLAVLPLRVWFLLKRERKLTAAGNPLAAVKISSWLALAGLQLATLVLWTYPPAARTRTTLATAALAPLATLSSCLLSHLEHTRAVRPSSLLGIFLLSTLLFDAAHTRTLWLRAGSQSNGHDHNGNKSLAHLSVAAAAAKAAVLVAEAVEKRRLLRPAVRALHPPEATSGVFSRVFFAWLNALFRAGFGRVLVVDDLFALDKHLQAAFCHARLRAAWALVTQKSPHALLRASFGVLKWPIAHSLFPRACLTALTFSQPFLINRAIKLSQEPITPATTQAGYGLIGAYFLVYVGIAASMGQYQHRTFRTVIMLRGALVAAVYAKTATLGLGVDPAAAMTLMSADMERIVQGCQTMHEVWANAAEVGVAIFLLQQQLGVACVVPVVVSVVALLGSLVAMNFIVSRQAMWLEAIERRISATAAMLAAMKGVKMCGLRDTLLASLQQLRVDELRISKRFRKLIIWNMVFAYVTQVFAPVLTFAVFSARARDADANTETLDTARVFTALSLFALLSEPLASLIMSLAAFLGGVGSFARIQAFLESAERADTRVRAPDHVSDTGTDTEKPTPPDAVTVHAGAFGWDAAEAPLLADISLAIPRNKLTMVVGPVGCGKSTLLHALLGEVPARGGSVALSAAGVAYCAQTPWHTNGSVRDAIVGAAADYDEKWYARVVRACALLRDFRQLPRGDASRIGSGGVALSGGQGQRIALARAVYARRELVLLDDALSGLDVATENHVFHSLLGGNGLLRELGATVVLASSSAARLPYADHVVVLSPSGTIAAQGSYAALNDAGGYVSSFALPRADWAGVAADTVDDGSSSSCTDFDEERDGTSLGESAPPRDDEPEPDTSRQMGDVQIYVYYVRSVGWWASLVFVVAIVGFVFCQSFPNVWVQWWAADNEAHPNSRLGYWLGIYAMLGGAAIVCLGVSCWQMIITMVPRSGERFHLALLDTVLSAPMSFFATTDSGITMNRFSQDLQLIDMELPIAALNTFATFVLCLAQMALIGVGSVYAAVSFPVVLGALYGIQKVYLRTSRQLRLMDLETKAPLYTLFEETLGGLATVRAFGWQGALATKNDALLDRSQRPFYLLFAVQRWLTLVLDLLVAAVAVLLVVLVVELRGTVAAGGVGLALLNVVQFSQNIKLLVTFWTMLETHIGSVARVKTFTETAVAEDLPSEADVPPPDWPAAGAIELEDLSAAYNGDDLVLKHVSLSVRAGEKIGVCGRTGSGKTSLVASLFRLLELRGGRIRVDGVDLATLPRQEVRRRIVAVPQHPFLLKGSVRLNADPAGAAADDAIVAALRSVQLLDTVERAGGLGVDIEGVNLSSGQRQLFCLARAMLRSSTILVLDEATSSIDAKTEETMQRLIRKRFASHTVIAVAHRLDTIMDFDKVAVLDGGRLVEFDSPYALLDQPGSAFARLYSATVADEDDVQGMVS
ncbi:P-loop containing nucleoside triphosphate hydrolase protein [Lasiosphaeria miniovina]|uniref:P-loop containing nucleoside triphosphate hydrolase protein n=1 Tax=Lasiosphaeria miniovina TaxID=1954250 RepID=A0AA40DND5_9PEZI|nr:P-loop containing nucleoside triphosphate hydrolase protein [Lasiosphaeria miniovina]KAK0706203.1 P-loop containing nucleoside triphosphate hydrolase protein [Lasiosphaeria miniovina]